MPVNLGTAQGEINIGTKGVIGAERVVKGAAANMERDLNRVGKGVGGLTEQFRKFDSFLGASFAIGAAVGVGKMVLELGKASAQAELTEKSFEQLAQGVGANADAMLEGMRKASRGVITDSALILGANRAIASNVADTGAEMNQILEIARATGQAFGFTTADAFDKIVRGVGKLEPELLDELGIMVRLDQVFRSYAASLGTTAEKLTEAQRRQALLNEVIRQSQDEVDAAAGSIGNSADKYERMNVATEKLAKSFGDLLNAGGVPIWVDIFSARIQSEIGLMEGWIELIEKAQRLVGMGGGGTIVSGAAPWGTRGAPPALPGAPGPRFGENQEKAEALAVDRFEAEKDIDRQATSDALEAKRNHADAVGDIERSYQTSSRREAEDFATSRLRAEADHLAQIADIREDAGRRETDAAEDLARTISRARDDSGERIAEARENANERLLELEEDFQKNRERANEDHRDKMLSAAGRLDAIALLEERKRFARESEDAKEAHDEQRDDLQEQLDERIADENEALAKSIANAQEAHDRQLEDARQADERRIQDMKDDFEARKILEDEDRAIRLTRMAEDHRARLDEMARQHQLDLEQIATDKADARAKLQEEFDKDFQELVGRNDAQIKEHNRYIENVWANYDLLNKRLALGAAGLVGTGAIGLPGSHPSGADPYVDRPMPQGSSIWTGAGIQKMINVHANAIQINGDGLNEREVAELIVDFLEAI